MESEKKVASVGDYSSKDLPIPLCDPHFHMLDCATYPNLNLGDAAQLLQVYSAKNYLTDVKQLSSPLCWVSGIHVETVVGQSEGPGIPDRIGKAPLPLGPGSCSFLAVPAGASQPNDPTRKRRGFRVNISLSRTVIKTVEERQH